MNFALEVKNEWRVIHCQTHLDASHCQEILTLLEEQVAQVAKIPALTIVLDLKDRYQVDPIFLRGLAPVLKVLEGKQKKLCLVNMPETNRALFEGAGLMSGIHILQFLPFESQPQELFRELQENALLLTGLSSAVVDTFKVLCPTIVPIPAPPFIKRAGMDIASELASMLEIKAKPFEGLVVLSFLESVYLPVVGAMHRTKYVALNVDNEDGIVEILNIVRSVSRKKLEAEAYMLDKGIPSVTKGKTAQKLLAISDRILVLPFTTAAGEFHLQIGISYRPGAN